MYTEGIVKSFRDLKCVYLYNVRPKNPDKVQPKNDMGTISPPDYSRINMCNKSGITKISYYVLTAVNVIATSKLLTISQTVLISSCVL